MQLCILDYFNCLSTVGGISVLLNLIINIIVIPLENGKRNNVQTVLYKFVRKQNFHISRQYLDKLEG